MRNRTLKLLLLDDDKEFIKHAKRLVGLMPDVKVAAEETNPTKGLKLLLEKHFDILLLDIDMPMLDGFGVMQQIKHLVEPVDPAVRPLFVIMCSGHKTRTQRCFDDSVSYFLEKPLCYGGLVKAITAYKKKMGIVPSTNDPNGGRQLMLTMEPDSERVSPTVFNTITAITVSDTICTVYLAGGRVEKQKKALSEFADFLPPNAFVQISRWAIIALAYFEYREGDYVFVKDCTEVLKLGSRESFPAFYQWYDDNYEGRRLG